MRNKKRYNRRKLKRKVELERQIQSLKDRVNGEFSELEEHMVDLEEQIEDQKWQLLALWSLALSTFALVLWHIIAHFTV